jgi:hypothetical protein
LPTIALLYFFDYWQVTSRVFSLKFYFSLFGDPEWCYNLYLPCWRGWAQYFAVTHYNSIRLCLGQHETEVERIQFLQDIEIYPRVLLLKHILDVQILPAVAVSCPETLET